MLQQYIRSTARLSFAIFLIILTAAPLQRLYPSAATLWLIDNRRYLGLSFALSHTLHMAAIAALSKLIPLSVPPATLFFGGIGYLLILAMAATSFDRAVKLLRPKLWKSLHTTGLYWNAVVFAVSFGGRAVKDPFYIPFVVLLLGALLLRGFSYLRR